MQPDIAGLNEYVATRKTNNFRFLLNYFKTAEKLVEYSHNLNIFSIFKFQLESKIVHSWQKAHLSLILIIFLNVLRRSKSITKKEQFICRHKTFRRTSNTV